MLIITHIASTVAIMIMIIIVIIDKYIYCALLPWRTFQSVNFNIQMTCVNKFYR